MKILNHIFKARDEWLIERIAQQAEGFGMQSVGNNPKDDFGKTYRMVGKDFAEFLRDKNKVQLFIYRDIPKDAELG